MNAPTIAPVTTCQPRRLTLYLIKPSRYDDDGYVIRHFRGVIPSNTLMALCGLTRNAVDRGELGDVRVETVLVDEAVERIPYRRIRRDSRRPDGRVVMALCGVQTNQFPRAQDLARRFRAQGLDVIVGGFHVSGANAIVPGTAPELQDMLDIGVHLVRGEVDDCWGSILQRLLGGTLHPITDRLSQTPDLTDMRLPLAEKRYLRRFAITDQGTIDAGRGCPFNCSFCTIVNVQGRKMRARSTAGILAGIRRHYAEGIRFYMFTDDNFARHPNWRQIFDGLSALRKEGHNLTFMMQVDTQAVRLDGFVEKAAAAGCVLVFIWMESIRDENLRIVGKRQNKVPQFRGMIDAWRNHGIVTHCGYILGFPEDTPESIAEDVQRLRDEVGTDLASFFMLTPLPGSADHARLVASGTEIDPDLNQFDTFHPVMDHPNMSREQWARSYRDAWRTFYTPEHMIRCLRRLDSRQYWTLFHNFVWCCNAKKMGEHPMMSGFFRMRDRTERRPGLPQLGWLQHRAMRIKDTAHHLRVWGRLLLEMQEVWLNSRHRSATEVRLTAAISAALFFRPARSWARLCTWFNRRRSTRVDLNAYWHQLIRLGWHRANPLKAPLHAMCELTLLTQFLSERNLPASSGPLPG